MRIYASQIEPIKQKLLDRVVEEPGPLPDPCWIWQGMTDGSDGYGRVKHRALQYPTHRLAYRVFVEDFPDEMLICHHCDTPLCIRPEHLYVGDPQSNSTDMVNRGRSAFGERNGMQVLSEEQVVEALQMLEAGKTQRFVARYFGVGASTIFEIAHNQSWQHIPGPRVIVKPPQSSRYFGVTRNEGKWVAHIRHKGTLLYFGRYAFEVDAAICVNYHVAYLGLDRPLNQIPLEEYAHD